MKIYQVLAVDDWNKTSLGYFTTKAAAEKCLEDAKKEHIAEYSKHIYGIAEYWFKIEEIKVNN